MARPETPLAWPVSLDPAEEGGFVVNFPDFPEGWSEITWPRAGTCPIHRERPEAAGTFDPAHRGQGGALSRDAQRRDHKSGIGAPHRHFTAASPTPFCNSPRFAPRPDRDRDARTRPPPRRDDGRGVRGLIFAASVVSAS